MSVMIQITIRYVLLLSILFTCGSCHKKIIYYPVIAHSHNDYEQEVPIKTALELGFTSLEVDIVYHEGRIVVSHDLKDLASKPEFEKDYLIPFFKEIEKERDYVLLIDLKNYSPELITQLNEILFTKTKYLVERHNLHFDKKGVKVLLSGDFPRHQVIRDQRNHTLFIDGRLEHLGTDNSFLYTPLISMNLRHVTQWRGDREPEEEELAAIRNVVEKVHGAGKLLRFWNTPDTEIMWRTLEDLQVDIIGVDDLQQFYDVNFSKWNK